jgi:adenylate kinase
MDNDPMRLVLIGGVSRAGKSTLCGRVNQLTGLPYFNLDFLTTGLSVAMKEKEISSSLTEWDIAEAIMPGMIRKIIRHGNSYMLEGGAIDLETMAGIASGYPKDMFVVVFLGYPNASVEEKLHAVMSDGRRENDWLRKKPLSDITAHIEEQIAVSRSYQERCAKLGIEFCDTSRDLDKVIEAQARGIARKVRR